MQLYYYENLEWLNSSMFALQWNSVKRIMVLKETYTYWKSYINGTMLCSNTRYQDSLLNCWERWKIYMKIHNWHVQSLREDDWQSLNASMRRFVIMNRFTGWMDQLYEETVWIYHEDSLKRKDIVSYWKLDLKQEQEEICRPCQKIKAIVYAL